MSQKKPNKDIVRSSAAEYLTFISATGQSGVEVIYADENIWLSQKMMGMLYEIEPNTINYHLKKIFLDNELEENSVIRKFRITANDGTAEIAKAHAETEFEKYRIVQDRLFESDFDRMIKSLPLTNKEDKP